VELNFRDEKTVLGVGEAQVRTKAAVENVPAFVVASYAYLLLAGTEENKAEPALPQPKWRADDPQERSTTARMIGMFRSQLWGKAMGVNLTDFVTRKGTETKPVLFENSLRSAVCYAFR
jgi:hypothetical protein